MGSDLEPPTGAVMGMIFVLTDCFLLIGLLLVAFKGPGCGSLGPSWLKLLFLERRRRDRELNFVYAFVFESKVSVDSDHHRGAEAHPKDNPNHYLLEQV